MGRGRKEEGAGRRGGGGRRSGLNGGGLLPLQPRRRFRLCCVCVAAPHAALRRRGCRACFFGWGRADRVLLLLLLQPLRGPPPPPVRRDELPFWCINCVCVRDAFSIRALSFGVAPLIFKTLPPAPRSARAAQSDTAPAAETMREPLNWLYKKHLLNLACFFATRNTRSAYFCGDKSSDTAFAQSIQQHNSPRIEQRRSCRSRRTQHARARTPRSIPSRALCGGRTHTHICVQRH